MTRMHLMSLDCSPACVCAWSQEGSQALMFLANYAKKKGDFAEAEQYCMPFQPFLRTAHLYSQSILVRVGFAQLLMLVFLNVLCLWVLTTFLLRRWITGLLSYAHFYCIV